MVDQSPHFVPVPQWHERYQLLEDTATRARRYLDDLPDRAVPPRPEDVSALARLDFPLPSAGLAPGELVAMLDDVGSPATVASAGPRYFGFVTGGAYPVAVATSWLLSAWDQNAALSVMSPVTTMLDGVAMRWLCDIFGLPAGTEGAFVSGATMANATCLAAARDEVLSRAGWQAGALGLVGAPQVEVVVGEEVHATVTKGLGLVGLGRERATRLAVDGQGRIVPRDLPRLEAPAIVCLQAGNVNTGASDPFVDLVDWARSQGAWVHVDGAFGMWAAACPELASEVSGLQGADSWATDSHKWLNTTYDCGVALVRDASALRAAMQANASYLPPGPDRDPMFLTPQSSQRARGTEVWAVLASLGRAGIAEMVATRCALARTFASCLSEAGFEILNDVKLNQVLVSFGSASRTEAVIAEVQREGTCWCGVTTWQGRRAMRVSVSNWATTEQDVRKSAHAVTRAATSLAGN